MIDAQELRIGNYLEHNKHGLIKVLGVKPHCDNHMIIHDDTWCYLTNCKPIPLTEQWLIDFGFEKFGDNSSFYLGCYEKGFTFDRYDSTQARIWWRGRYLGICQRLGSVHQLQNLYFALTGKDLTKK